MAVFAKTEYSLTGLELLSPAARAALAEEVSRRGVRPTPGSPSKRDLVADRLVCFLLGREKLVSRPLRLLGLGVAGLREPSGQQLVLL